MASYLPAYALKDFELERAGRVEKAKKTEAPVDSSLPATTDAPIDDGAAPAAPAPAAASASEKTSSSLFSGVGDAATAGFVVVGDEVLKGACADVNTPVLARALREHGVGVVEVYL